MAPKFDMSTPKGLAAFNGYISSRSYMEGYAYSQADADMFSAFTGTPDKTKAPHAYRWFIHIASIIGVQSLNIIPTSCSAPPAKEAPKPKAAAPSEDTDDKVDRLFDDDDESDEDKEASKPEKTACAEVVAKAKAAKPASKKIDRSQIVFEVKPWEANADLKSLHEKIVKEEIDGLVWGEGYKLMPVAFGVKKLVLSCVVDDSKVGVEDITDVIEKFEEEVQSVDMTTMNRL